MTLAELSELARAWWGVWLMLLFLGIVAWVVWPSEKRNREMRRNASIPLQDDDPTVDAESR